VTKPNEKELDVIAKRIDKVVLERDKKTGHLYARSKGKDTRYKLVQRPDGVIFCECPAWRYDMFRVDKIVRKPKAGESHEGKRSYRPIQQRVCKHTVAAMERDEEPLMADGTAPPAAVKKAAGRKPAKKKTAKKKARAG